MGCIICDNGSAENLLYENDKVKIMLAPRPASDGHIIIYSKDHYPILEQVPDDLLKAMSGVANRISMLLFEILKVHGTNILIQNGIPAGQEVPHFAIHVIPRRNDDGIKLDWSLKQATPESLESMHRIISEGMNVSEIKSNVQDAEFSEIETIKAEPQSESSNNSQEEDTKSLETEEKPVNYYLKSLERIP
jgi:histidine triad (HIT) family protein